MAIQSTATGTTQNNQPQQGQPQPSGFAGGNAFGTGQTQPTYTAADAARALGGALQSDFSSISASARLRTVRENFTKVLGMTANNSQNEYKLTVVDAATSNIPLSVVTLSLKIKNTQGVNVACASLIIDDEQVTLNNRSIQVMQGSNVELPSVAGDIWDVARPVVIDQVKVAWGGSAAVIDGGAMVLPRDKVLDTTTTANSATEILLNQILVNLSNVCVGMSDIATGNSERVFSIPRHITPQTLVTCRVDFNPSPDHDINGNPVRNDFTVSVGYGMRNQQGAEQQNTFVNASKELVRISGYVELDYFQPNQMMGQMGFGMQQGTQCFAPRIVITRIGSPILRQTPETVVLAFVAMTTLAENMAWAYAFRKRNSAITNKMRDIGAVGLFIPQLCEGNKPAIIDTTRQDFGVQQMMTLIRAAILPMPSFSIDLPETGENSHLNIMLAALAANDVNALAVLLRSLNTMSGNKLDEIRNQQNIAIDQVLIPNENRIQLGTWLDSDGKLRDCREIDTLGVMNRYGENDPDAVKRWLLAHSKAGHPVARLADKQRIINDMTGQTFQLKEYANRYTINPKFLDLARRTVVAAGLTIQPDNVQYTLDGGQMGYNFDQLQNMVFNPANSVQVTSYGGGSNQFNMNFGGGAGGFTKLF